MGIVAGLGPAFFAYSPGTTGLLSPYTTDLWGAYDLQQLLSTATLCIRIRRSSDNAELDIGFSGTAIDAAAIAAFVGSSSAYVVKWYDQSGAGHDFAQATSGYQPRIVNAGTYDGVLVFDGSDDTMITAATSTASALTLSLFMFGATLRGFGSGAEWLYDFNSANTSKGAGVFAGSSTRLSIAVTAPGGFGGGYEITDYAGTAPTNAGRMFKMTPTAPRTAMFSASGSLTGPIVAITPLAAPSLPGCIRLEARSRAPDLRS